MPNLDKTGPNAEGSMTGRGMGNCKEGTSFIGGRGRGRGRHGQGKRFRCNQVDFTSHVDELLKRIEELEEKLNYK